jgi:KaiC/GvpD/RAD55 family RecA-like ATPase
MERVPTGITGLDELIEGGFPRGRSVLLAGGCGTGKSIFCSQFLFEGAKTYSEPGVYITLDERPDLLRQDMLRFGRDLRSFEEKNLLTIVDGSIAKTGLPSEEEFSFSASGFDFEKLLLETTRIIKRTDAQRVVVDSIPGFGINFETDNDARKAILKLTYLLSQTGATTVLTSEMNEGGNKYGKYGVEEYVADGVVVLHYMGMGTHSNRTLHIRKMRATKHSEDLHPLKITASGLSVQKIDEAYEDA